MEIINFFSIFSILSLNVFAKPACNNNDWSELKKIMDNLTCELDTDNQLQNCLNNTCGVNMAINDCINTMISKCQNMMNNIYNQKLKKAETIIYNDEFNKDKGTEKIRLTNSQSYWEKYLESHCNVNMDFNASNTGNNISECKLNKIKGRIKELQNIYK